MMVNKISFKLSQEIFGADANPTDVVEIYIDGDKLSNLIPTALPLWPSELYENLRSTSFAKEDSVNIYVCECGCVGCGDTEVFIDETDNFVIWHDFITDRKSVAEGIIFVFDRGQYYQAVDKLTDWIE